MAEASIRARIAADASGFHQALKSTESAAVAWGQRMARTTAGAGAGMGRGGSMALLELSRAIEDAQFGIKGVLNNIPTLAMALGGGAGLAGAASIAAVAVASLGEEFSNFVSNAGGIKAATDQLDKLDAKLKGAVGKSAEEAIRGTAEATLELKDAIKAADEEFAATSAFIAASQADEETRLRAQMQARLSWLARIEEVAAQAALRQRETAEESKALREETDRAHREQVQQRRELLEMQRTQLRTLNPQDPRAIELAGSITALESEQMKLPDRTREELAANRALAAVKDHQLAEAAAAEAREKNASQEATTVAQIANAKVKAAKEAAQAQREADEVEDAFRRENLRQQQQEDALEEKQLDRLAKLQAAYDKEADALRKINREHQESLGNLEKQARIKGLRETGRDTQADREERAMRIEDRRQDIMKLGASPAHAVDLATQLEGGRGRINARSRRHRQAGGIDEITEAPRGSSSNELRKQTALLNQIKDSLSGRRDDKGDPVPRE